MFRLIVISPPSVLSSDLPVINSLLRRNIFFHLRINEQNSLSTADILDAIDETQHYKIIIHQDYHLAGLKNIRGVHLPEKVRVEFGHSQSIRVVSTSIHSLSEFTGVESSFEYIFYAPVFPSISKSNYHPAVPFNSLKEELNRISNKQKLIALGGITAGNIMQVKEAGFGGAAFIGSVWTEPDPLSAYSGLERAARGVVK